MKQLSNTKKRGWLVTLLISASLLLVGLPAQAELQPVNDPLSPLPSLLARSPSSMVLPSSEPIGTVAILEPTVSGGMTSIEALSAISLGYAVDIIPEATWATMTTEQFAAYDALILGDPTCSVEVSDVAAAESNAGVWASAVEGNVIIIGADPVYHVLVGEPGAQTLIDNGIAFALDDEGTGAYITLSCYYHYSPSGTPVPMLDGFGSFEVAGAGTTGALNDVHIVASHDAMNSLTDADLSNWGNSVHENFEVWPFADFEVLALANHSEGSYTAGDGSVGYPYILARGVIPDYCGNGEIDPGEECDDGNNVDGDGCSATCNLEPEPDPEPDIPEFPTIALPIVTILGLMFLFQRRKD